MKRKLEEAESSSSGLNPIDIKQEDPTLDHSQDVRKRSSAASRTGTACDRCRVRKMRCDDNPDGCASCRQAQTECKTTDRITGKAAVRGYVESLEARLAELEQRNQELQAEVLALGGQITQDSWNTNHPSSQSHSHEEVSRDILQTSGNLPAFSPPRPGFQGSKITSTGHDRPGTTLLPQRRNGLWGNNYFGISTGDNFLSSVRGTSMNILGMEIDLTEYLNPDVDEPNTSGAEQPTYNKSYTAFVHSAFGLGPRLEYMDLPAPEEGMELADIFLRITVPFVPVVHAPSFVKMLERIYQNRPPKPTSSETVMVHSAMAIAYWNSAVRNARDEAHQLELHRKSNLHFHYALGLLPHLMASHRFEDVQALAVLSVHARNSIKPSAAWMLTSLVLNLAIDLGLHRSSRHWTSLGKLSILDIEMRKRVFWSIIWIQVLICGSLGRPMALQNRLFDVELPEVVDDKLLSDQGIDTSRPGICNFLAGIENFKVLPIYVDLYNIIWSVGEPPPNYEASVNALERRLQEWQEQWPIKLLTDAAAQPELGRIHLQYLRLWRLQIRLLLRHPSLSFSSSDPFNAESLTICMETCKDLLDVFKFLQRFRGMDVSWATSALLVLTIATTLYGHRERKSHLALQGLEDLKQDMQDWLSIIGDFDTLLDAKGRLSNLVKKIIDTAFLELQQNLIAKAAPQQARAPATSIPTGASRSNHPMSLPNGYPSTQRFPTVNSESPSKNSSATSYRTVSGNVEKNQMRSYHSQYEYPPPHDPSADFGNNLQQQAHLNAGTTLDDPYMTSYPQNAYQDSYIPPTGVAQVPGSPTSWRNFTGNIITPASGDFLSPPQPLLQMENGPIPIPNIGQRQNNVYGAFETWPMFDPNIQ